jgi:hypothetical protein
MRRPLFLLLLFSLASAAGADTIHGLVYVDHNGNGRRDDGEPGVADVQLSNGREIVRSSADGRYRIALQAGDTLFLVKPPGYALPSRADGLPEFWQHHFPDGSPALRYGGIAAQVADGEFALLEAGVTDGGLDVLLFGDPQVKSLDDVDYYARDIVAPLVGRHQARLGLSLGDIVDDELSLYPAINAVTARLGVPWLHVPGNHDLDLDAADDRESLLTFRAHYGPDSYAWEEPEASFVVLDDVIHLPGGGYVGGLREDQFAFLEAYLAGQPAQRRIIVALHIPLFEPVPGRESFRRADRERLFALLAKFDHPLVLSAHTHAQRHHFHREQDGWTGHQPLHEYNVGATCGGFWGGVADADGIPDAGMADGTPNGYARLRLDGRSGYGLFWQVARAAESYQIALHAPKVLRHGAYPAVAVYANVFMGMDDSRVEYRVGNGDWQPLQRVERADPRVLAENLRDDASERLRGHDRMPEARPSTHLWRGALPTDLAPGEHPIEVRAFDRWRGELRASTRYRLEPAQ